MLPATRELWELRGSRHPKGSLLNNLVAFLPHAKASCIQRLDWPYVDFWSSLSTLFIPLQNAASTSECLSLPEHQSASSIQKDHSVLPGIPLPAPQSGTGFQTENEGNYRAHLICFPCLRNNNQGLLSHVLYLSLFKIAQ